MNGNTLPRPHFRGLPNSSLNRTSQSVYTGTTVFESAPNTKVSFAPKKLDFERGAKEFKKKQLVGSLLKGLTDSLIIIAIFVSLITIVGFLVNSKFQGKSLPLTYAGDVSIGGKTKAEIKALLDDQYNNMYITLSEGGLKRQLKLSQLDIKMDTMAIADKAVPKHPNPFSFLNWTRLEVPIAMSDRYVTGYIERRINSGQSSAEDASIVMDKSKLSIQPEIEGFRSNSKFIIGQLRLALTNCRAPNIDVTAVTDKPKVRSSDLADDLARINNLLQTPINIKYGYGNLRPTLKQKMAWLKLDEKAGAKNVNVDFSVGLIRMYIIDQVNRYQTTKTEKNADGETEQTTNKIVIENVDEVANSVAIALKTGNKLTQQLVIRNSNDNFTVVSLQSAPASAVAAR